MEVPRDQLAQVEGEAVVDEVIGEPQVVPGDRAGAGGVGSGAGAGAGEGGVFLCF